MKLNGLVAFLKTKPFSFGLSRVCWMSIARVIGRMSQLNERSRSMDKAAQILQGALQEFLLHGYAGTSMDKVATTAGVSKPTVYSYFQDKEGLFRALVDHIAQQRFQILSHLDALEVGQGDPKATLRQLMRAELPRILNDAEYHDFVRLVIGESGRFPEIAQAFVERITQPCLRTVARYLARHPELKIADPEATAQVLMGSCVFFILTQQVLHGKETIPMTCDRMIDALLNLALGTE